MSNASHMRYATISLGCEAHLHDICLYRLHLFLPVFCTVKGTHSFLNRQHVAIFMFWCLMFMILTCLLIS